MPLLEDQAKALHRLCGALGLPAGSDTTQEGLKAIHTLQADNNYLRAVIAHMATADGVDLSETAQRVLAAVPRATLRALEEEYDALRERGMTPTMEAIIQAVHDTAGKGQEGDDVVVTVSAMEYENLCAEERFKEAELADSVENRTRANGETDDDGSGQVDNAIGNASVDVSMQQPRHSPSH